MNRQTAFAWVDMLHVLVFALLVVVVTTLAVVKAEQSADTVGEVWIMATWPDGSQADVDLWVRGPGDRPVGYSSKNSRTMDLLRDDLGHTADITGQNYEVVISHGIAPGEYVVNLHLYRPDPALERVPVHVTVQILGQGVPLILYEGTTEVFGRNEFTVVRVTLNEAGELVSKNTVPTPLRNGGS